ncbi:RNA polymerase sigma-70 factor (ECF subfamily) [Paenibacillus castaneae]|uniref:RNA polymerase sigma factor n=1 Tax=Paenibacillus castaneae TaxID=474957 RepID=UPI000C9A2FB1|nr:RNA polymerase sigma factor [Paenibacillus castaneae]NIK78614.1 RNA polymerase sigma-70 factor (ECF subfamily) [Paenibacillus castaneae]
MPTDEQLIQEIQKGSQAAMEVLVKRYYKQIYAYLYRKTSSAHTAYDLTQDVFIKLVQKLPSYKSKGSFSSWLFTIAINCSRDYYRSAAYRQAAASSEYEEHLDLKQEESVSYIFERNESRKLLKQAVKDLPDIQSEAILLKYYHDMKIKEIAAITSTNENTVKARLRQGLDKLRKMLGRDEHEQKHNQ